MRQKPPLWKRVIGAVRATAKRATRFGLSSLLYGAIGGGSLAMSAAGVDVTVAGALQNSSFFKAVSLLSNAVGKTQFEVKSGADIQKAHPAHQLVKWWARHHQLSADMFRRTMMIHALLHGNGYALIIRENAKPVRLVILNHAYVTPELVNGDLRYKITDPDLKQEKRDHYVHPSDIIHIKGFSIDGWIGLDPIRYYASETMGLAIATQKYAASYYENGGTPTAYIKTDGSMSDEQWSNFENRVAAKLSSDLKNPHKMPVLEQMSIESTGVSAADSQLLEGRKLSMLEIANLMSIPPHKLGLTQSSAYKSLEEENKAFREDAVEPWLCQFEMQFRKLLTEVEQERESHRVEANRFDLSKTDLKSRFEALAKATGGAAFMTSNDARKLNGDDPHPDGDGLHIPPTNEKKETDENGDDADTTDENGEPADRSTDSAIGESHRSEADIITQTLYRVQALTDVYSRMTKRLAVEASKRAKRSEEFPDYLEQLSDAQATTLRAMLQPIIGLCGGRSDDAGKLTDALLTEFRQKMAAVYDTAPRDEFHAGVSQLAEDFKSRSHELAHSALTSFYQEA